MYQLIISFPKNKAINVPITKKGAKGTWLFKVFLPKAINPISIIAPIKKAENRATKILGQLKKSPIKKPNLTSPNPIQRPRDISQKRKKKPAAPKPLKIEELKIEN